MISNQILNTKGLVSLSSGATSEEAKETVSDSLGQLGEEVNTQMMNCAGSYPQGSSGKQERRYSMGREWVWA